MLSYQIHFLQIAHLHFYFQDCYYVILNIFLMFLLQNHAKCIYPFNLFSFIALRFRFSESEISFLSIFLLALSTCSFRFFSLTSLSFIYSLLDFAPLLLLSDSLVAAKFSFLFAKSAVSISAIFLQEFSKICFRGTT